jgi:DNA-binding HxlR family transcriptional regulator
MLQLARVSDVQRTSFESMNCSVAQCLEVVGEWWSMLIIRDAFLGVRRFDDFQSRLGISRNILNVRLTSLVDAGVLERVPYQEHPRRNEYRLTDKGRDLWPVLTTMREWGDKWAAPRGAPLEVVHDACGEVMHLEHTCSACHQPADGRSVRVRPGPGATAGDLDRTTVITAP